MAERRHEIAMATVSGYPDSSLSFSLLMCTERVIRTIREDLMYFIFKKSKQLILQRLLEYKEYYNKHRPHTSLGLKTPANAENICPGPDYRLVSTPVLGGLHHTYHWEKAA